MRYTASGNFMVIAKHRVLMTLLMLYPVSRSANPALGRNVVLGSVVDHLWDISLNHSTRTVYKAGFRVYIYHFSFRLFTVVRRSS